MNRCTVAAALGLAVAVTACAHKGGASDQGSPATPPDTVSGIVRQVGSVPFLMTIIQGEDTAAVQGALEEEIRRLVGARVRVFGERAEGAYPGPTVTAAGYEILSVDGERPEVGVLRTEGGSYFLAQEGQEAGRLELSSVPDGLRRHLGGKVWVITSESGGAVLRYGLLRPAGAAGEEDGQDGDGTSAAGQGPA